MDVYYAPFGTESAELWIVMLYAFYICWHMEVLFC